LKNATWRPRYLQLVVAARSWEVWSTKPREPDLPKKATRCLKKHHLAAQALGPDEPSGSLASRTYGKMHEK
jgi:hypothetical protein